MILIITEKCIVQNEDSEKTTIGIRIFNYKTRATNFEDAVVEYANNFDTNNIICNNSSFEGKCLDSKVISIEDVNADYLIPKDDVLELGTIVTIKDSDEEWIVISYDEELRDGFYPTCLNYYIKKTNNDYGHFVHFREVTAIQPREGYIKILLKALENKKIIDGINANFTKEAGIDERIIEESLKRVSDNNRSEISIRYKDAIIDFEYTVHKAIKDNAAAYLIEARVFVDEGLLSSYLQVLTSDLEIVDKEIDDVWSFADWE